MELYFKKPASCWLEGFPLGNGRIGAMLHGEPDHEVLQLNEDTLWSGTPYNGQTGLSPEAVKEARELAQKGRYKEAMTVLEEKLKDAEDVQIYLPFGDLHLDFLEDGAEYTAEGMTLAGKEPGNLKEQEAASKSTISGYERRLDLETASASAKYMRNGVKFTRSCFVSAPASGLVYQLKAEKPFSLLLSGDGGFLREKNYTNDSFTFSGICPGRSGFLVSARNRPEDFLFPEDPKAQGIHYMAMGSVKVKAGTASGTAAGILCKDITELEIRMGIRTSFRGFDKAYPEQYTDDEIKAMLEADLGKLERPFEKLFQEHVQEYRGYFGRTSLKLWEDSDAAAKEETARTTADFTEGRTEELSHMDLLERLNCFNKGGSDPELYAILFAFGKYLLISSSRPGTQAGNLQGIWSNDLIPPWFADYTLNINTEMNYWMTGPLNLPEIQEPLVKLVEKLAKNGRKTARELLGCEGTAAFHNADLWGKTSPAAGMAMWAFWPFGQAWLCRNLFDQYLFTEDRDYLKRILPILEENVRFCLAQLQETENGLGVCPATSPENQFFEDCSVALYSENTLAIIRNLFRDYIQGSQELKESNALINDVQRALQQMVPTAIGSKGQILEWNGEFPEQDVHHRHLSHLYELHPGRGITPQTPELYEGARKSLTLRGDEGTGWSLAWKLLMWARMEDGEHAGKIMRNLFHVVDPREEMSVHGGGIYPNLFCAHPPFQIDGNLGYSAAVAELLVQSHGEEIVLFPALPPEWKNGEARGFLARGGIQADLKWNGKNAAFTLTSHKDQTIRLRAGKGETHTYFLHANIPYEGSVILE